MTVITIRQINFKADIETILKLEQDIFKEDAFPFFEFVYLYMRGKETFLIAHEGKQLAGYISVYVEEDTGYIASIAVDNNFRRQGIGRQLIQHIIDILQRNNKVTSIELHVRKSNHAAIELYKSLGFKVSFTELEYYGDEDAFMMRLALN